MNEKRKKAARKPASLLRQLASMPEALFGTPFELQYAALCYRWRERILETLVITSRDSGRWIVPKGWPMDGFKPHRTAEIEAWEEAGVRGKAEKKPFGYFTYLKYAQDGTRRPCCVHVYLLEVDRMEAVFPELGQRRSEWVSCAQAALRVREPELKGLFFNFERQMMSR